MAKGVIPMKETPKMPIWMLIMICIISVVIVLAIILQILLDISIPGLIPFATALLFVPMLISYFRSNKKDTFLLVVFLSAFLLNVAGGILQLITNGN